jgi:hypothetical protein
MESVTAEAVWTFGRLQERVVLRREQAADGILLLVTENGTPRSYRFSDVGRLLAFQSDMEAFLVRTGWSLLEFSPDRRTGRDRRQFPRLAERRRWWTDGTARAALVGGRRRRHD